MKIATAKMLFSEGVLIKARAVKNFTNDGYVLEMSKASTPDHPEALLTDKSEIRVFKTADALLNTAAEVGFREVTFYR